MKRTDAVALDTDFEYVGEIIKSYVDEATGKRYIVGAASGLEEDRDGERVSKRAISGMVSAVGSGHVKLTGSHEQNWLTEIGDAVEAHIDPETDQFMVKTELPPEGTDAIADKAWTETHRRKMGFSVGGKLRAAYHELTDLGKKRKVLDSIDLRHLCLTDKPAYSHSFANAVAKTFTGDAPADEQFVEEDVAKDVTGNWDAKGGGNSGQDSETGGKRNAGTKKPGSKGMSVDDDGKEKPEDDDDEESVEPAERHLSCPQCGHEFAADIPVDMTPEEREDQDKRKDELADSVPGDGSGSGSEPDEESADNNDKDEEEDEDGKRKPAKSTAKSRKATMDLEKRVKELEDLVAKQADEAKRRDAEGVADGKISADVMKVATDEGVDPGVLKVIALATGDQEERLEKTRTELSEGFEILGKAVMEIREAIGSLPTGRKSVARVLKSGREDEPEETIDEQIEKAESPVEALKILNEHTYGIK
jgi:hypothetical protein